MQYAGPHEVSLLTNSHAGRGWSGEAATVAVRQRVSLRRAGAVASCFAPGVGCRRCPRYFAPVFCGSSAAVIVAVLSGRAGWLCCERLVRARPRFVARVGCVVFLCESVFVRYNVDELIWLVRFVLGEYFVCMLCIILHGRLWLCGVTLCLQWYIVWCSSAAFLL